MAVRARKTLLTGVVLVLALGGATAGHGVYLAAKGQLAQILLQRAWDRTLATGAPQRPWSWADTHPVARLRAPGHGVDRIVLAGSSRRTLAFGPGHLGSTAAPGTPGLSLISGHRDTHFSFLADLGLDDVLLVQRPDGVTRRFAVVRAAVIDLAHGAPALDPLADRLVLVTCYPFRRWSAGGTRRYVVMLAPRDRPARRPGRPAIAETRHGASG